MSISLFKQDHFLLYIQFSYVKSFMFTLKSYIVVDCVKGNLYIGTIQRYTVKEILNRTVLCVAKGLSPGTN